MQINQLKLMLIVLRRTLVIQSFKKLYVALEKKNENSKDQIIKFHSDYQLQKENIKEKTIGSKSNELVTNVLPFIDVEQDINEHEASGKRSNSYNSNKTGEKDIFKDYSSLCAIKNTNTVSSRNQNETSNNIHNEPCVIRETETVQNIRSNYEMSNDQQMEAGFDKHMYYTENKIDICKNKSDVRSISKNIICRKFLSSVKSDDNLKGNASNVINKKQATKMSTKFVLASPKIIKPNVVINNNIEVKHSAVNSSSDLQEKQKLTQVEQKFGTISPFLHTAFNKITNQSSRLQNKPLIPSIKVKKLIIPLRTSETETSDDEDYVCIKSKNSTTIQPNITSLCTNEISKSKPLVTTSMSCQDRSYSSNNVSSHNNFLNENFEKQLDSFLKNARAQVNQNKNSKITNNANLKLKTINEKNFVTPVAVRHLPENSQREYRLLVNRMINLIERRKQNETKGKNKNKYFENNSKSFGSTLEIYESLFSKTSLNIVTCLDKSLQIVQKAKDLKLIKLQCDEHIRQLEEELDKAREKSKKYHEDYSFIFSDISSSTDKILLLKKKNSTFIAAARNLGKKIQGDSYRLNEPLKEKIALKSKQLKLEIDILNTLKASSQPNIAMIAASEHEIIGKNIYHYANLNDENIKNLEHRNSAIIDTSIYPKNNQPSKLSVSTTWVENSNINEEKETINAEVKEKTTFLHKANSITHVKVDNTIDMEANVKHNNVTEKNALHVEDLNTSDSNEIFQLKETSAHNIFQKNVSEINIDCAERMEIKKCVHSKSKTNAISSIENYDFKEDISSEEIKLIANRKISNDNHITCQEKLTNIMSKNGDEISVEDCRSPSSPVNRVPGMHTFDQIHTGADNSVLYTKYKCCKYLVNEKLNSCKVSTTNDNEQLNELFYILGTNSNESRSEVNYFQSLCNNTVGENIEEDVQVQVLSNSVEELNAKSDVIHVELKHSLIDHSPKCFTLENKSSNFDILNQEGNVGIKTKLTQHNSQLKHLNNNSCKFDPNIIICPFELMGNCADANCNYIHLKCLK